MEADKDELAVEITTIFVAFRESGYTEMKKQIRTLLNEYFVAPQY